MFSRINYIWVVLFTLLIFIVPNINYAQDNSTNNVTLDAQTGQSFEQQLTSEADLEIITKENQRCIRCHKKERLIKKIQAISSVGAHTSEKFMDNCTACHGMKDKHPKNSDNLVYFSKKSPKSIFEQNQSCSTCHTEKQLRDADWTHDVHVRSVLCSSCHTLHSKVDAIKNIEHVDRILLCIDCHGVGN